MTLRLVAFSVLLVGCFNPTFDHPSCGPHEECPSGLVCEGGRCVDTATRDATLDDSVTIDSPADAAVHICDRADILFCEDFENVPTGTPSSPYWTINQQGPLSLVIDSTHAMGSHALHVGVASSQTTYVFGVLRKTMTLPGNNAYVRYRKWISGFIPNVHGTFSSVIGSGSSDRASPADYTTLSAGTPRWMSNGMNPGGAAEWFVNETGMTAPSAVGQFTCFEYQIDAAANTIRSWVDGSLRMTTNASTVSWAGTPETFQVPTVTRLEFGVTKYQTSSTAQDVWIDDLVVAQAPIGCGP